jgi:cob(I)alamin adenosyltransferase
MEIEKNSLHKSNHKSMFSNNSHLKIGLTHYYCGDGKGKTTTLIGLLVRALGHNLNPILIQFLKQHREKGNMDGFFIGEIHFLKQFIDIRQFGTGSFLTGDIPENSKENESIKEGFKFAVETVKSGKYELVALDEIVTAVSMNLIELNDLINLIKNKPNNVELIITGMMYYKKLRDVADYIVSFNSIDHPFNKGILARKGIDY